MAGWALGIFVCATGLPTRADAARSCVWKVTAENGATAYLGGSIHELRSTDYPLPPAFNRAFDASERMALEVDPNAMAGAGNAMTKAGHYRRGDNLRKHVDPRTYAYLRRLFGMMRVPEAEWSRYRPWAIVQNLQSPNSREFSGGLGVEAFLLNRAKRNRKPVTGLETLNEHIAVFSGLNDKQSELLLLHTLMPQDRSADDQMPYMPAWRNGDADRIAAMMREQYGDFPSFEERLLGARNRRWIPKIEGYLQSGHTYFVVAGAAHFGGPDGVVALLRARGYQIAQL